MMLSTQEKEDLAKQLQSLKSEVNQLKGALALSDEQKKELIEKKASVSKEIVSLINKNKIIRTERNNLTAEVKALKERRNSFNSEISKLIDELKKIKEENREKSAKEGITESPSQLKSQMEKMNYKLETEVVSFEKEKQIMKVINELKKKYESAKKASGNFEKYKEQSRKIDAARTEANKIHKEMKEKAELSQKKHEEIIENDKKIDELKKQEEELIRTIGYKKTEIAQENKQLEEKLKPYADASQKLSNEKKEARESRETKKKKKLSEMKSEVQEKINKREKLTTEDILVLQSEGE